MSLIQHSNDFLLSLYVIDNMFNRKTQMHQIAFCTISCGSYQKEKKNVRIIFNDKIIIKRKERHEACSSVA